MKNNLKKVISTFAALTMALSSFSAFAANFTDVADTASYKQAVDELVALKVVSGYAEDGTFRPDNNVTRAEAAKMIVAGYGPAYTASAEAASNAVTNFTDVDNANGSGTKHWGAGYVKVGVDSQFINGYGDGTFGPDDQVTYAQAVKMLMVCLGFGSLAENNGGWPNGYLTLANQYGVTDGVAVAGADTYITRAQFAQLIDNAINTPIVDQTYSALGYTKVLDGTGRNYQTLLINNHNAYKVKGRVVATNKSTGGDASLSEDEVTLRIEVANNFENEYVNVRSKSDDATDAVDITAYVGDTIAADLLYTYADFVIQLDPNTDEYTILAVSASAKNDTVELDANDFKAGTTEENATFAKTNRDDYDYLRAYKTDSISNTKRSYKVSKNVKVVINGTEMDAELSSLYKTYLEDNETGTVTLVDTPQEGSTNKDGIYDYIVIDYKRTAVVDEVDTANTEGRVYLSEGGTLGALARNALIKINLDDEDYSYKFTLNGKEIKYTDLQENDVLSIAYNPNVKDINESYFLDVIVTRGAVEGTVTRTGTKNDKTYIVVDGKEYYCNSNIADELKAGESYSLYVDSDNNVVYYDELASSVKYALLERAIYNDTRDENTITLATATGVQTLVLNTKVKLSAMQEICYANKKDGNKNSVDKRMVTYKTNSKNEVTSVTALADTKSTESIDGVFNERTSRVDNFEIGENTVILNVADAIEDATAETYKASDVTTATLANFEDDETYQGYVLNDRYSDGTVKFVVITEGAGGYAPAASLAFVQSVSNNGDNDVITAVVKGEVVDLEFDGDALASGKDIAKGDAIAYKLDGEGLVKDAELLFSAADLGNGTASDLYRWQPTGADPFQPSDKYGNTWYVKSGIDKWDNKAESDDKAVRLAYGVVADKMNGSLSLLDVDVKDGTYTSYDNGGNNYAVATDVNVAVLDFSTRDQDVEAGRLASASATSYKRYADEKTHIVDWSDLDENAVTTAFVKVVDKTITDIYYFVSNY